MSAFANRAHAMVFALAVAILVPVAHAADPVAAAPVDVSYPSGSETVHALLYSPAGGAAKHPAVIVIHEWWGTGKTIATARANSIAWARFVKAGITSASDSERKSKQETMTRKL